METICWEIRVDTNGFLRGVITAQCYGITLRFQGNATRSSVEHPSCADLPKMKRSKANKIIGSVEQGDGDGDAKPIMASMGVVLQWVSTAGSK